MRRSGAVFIFIMVVLLKIMHNESKTVDKTLTINAISLPADDTPKVKLTLFYESYCPFSVKFIEKQLYPTVMKYADYLDLDLIPFGNCKSTQEPDGDWDFKCQHGEKECYGNRVHACVIDQGRDKGNGKTVLAIACLMKFNYSDFEIQQCLKHTNFSWRRHQRCMLQNATSLEVAYGKRTYNNVPKVKYVPFVMLNGVFNQTLENRAVSNLEAIICDVLGASKPDQCPGNYLDNHV